MSQPNSNDPGSVPLEEMLDRLKSRRPASSSSEEQIVTREDGSQVIRKRKRKRRSSQPAKEAEKRQKKGVLMQLMGVIILLVAFAVTFVFCFLKYNGKGYFEEVKGNIESETGADVTLSEFTVKPTLVTIGKVSLETKEGQILSKLSLSGVRASRSLLGFFTGELKGSSVDSLSGVAHFKFPTSLASSPESTKNEKSAFDFDNYACSKFNAFFGASEPYALEVKKTGISWSRRGDEDNLSVRGGELTLAGAIPLKIRSGTLVVKKNQELELRKVMLRTESDGEIAISDSIVMAEGKNASLDCELTSVKISELFPQKISRLMVGSFSSKEATMNFRQDSDMELIFKASLGVGAIQLKGFPFLSEINESFERINDRPKFITDSEKGGFIERRGNNLVVSELNLVESGELAIKGHFEVSESGELTGELSVGVAKKLMIAADGKPYLNGFSKPRGHFCWINIQLSGTARAPKDNFAELIEAAKDGGAKGPSSETLDEIFEDLVQPPK